MRACYLTCSPADTLAQLEPSRFTQILAHSDGMCGSTCGFFGPAALFHSLSNPALPRFRFVVYGGAATVFQGGT